MRQRPCGGSGRREPGTSPPSRVCTSATAGSCTRCCWRGSRVTRSRTWCRTCSSRHGSGSTPCAIRRRSAGRGGLAGGMAMIARNRATDAHRRTAEFVELPADLAGRGAASDAAEAHAALAAIRTLPEAYRETLLLRLVEGLTGPEIAERTGLTPASVRVNLHRGMKLLREKLDR